MKIPWLSNIQNWLDRTANPIVLQEVRSLLSLTRTMVVYGLVVFLLSVSSCQSVEFGTEFPMGLMLGTFSLVSLAVLPAQIMFSGNTRWSKDKLEMLNLTQLRPMDIVIGRVMAGFAMVFLFGSLLLPFFGLMYLLPGVQIGLLLTLIAGIALASLLAIVITINLGWHLEDMAFSSLGKVVWLLMLLQCSFLPIGLGTELLRRGGDWSEDLLQVLPWILSIWALLMFFGIARSVVLLRHPESNKSTPIRLAVSGLILFSWVFMFVIGSVDAEVIEGVMMFDLAFITVLAPSFLLEAPKLGRKALVDLPEKRLHRILQVPWLPGSGTAVLFLFLLLFGTIGVAQMVAGMHPPSANVSINLSAAFSVASMLLAYVAILIPLFSEASWLNASRNRRRFAILYFPSTFAPFGLLSFLTLDDGPINVFGTYVVPFALSENLVRNTVPDTSILIWATLVFILTFVTNRRKIFQNVGQIVSGVQSHEEPQLNQDAS